MKNILQWLKRNFYVVLFLALEVFSIGLFFRYHQMQESLFFNLCTGIKGRCFSVLGDVRGRRDLLSENARLQEENARLYARLENSCFRAVHTRDSLPTDTLYRQMYVYLEAGVLHATFANTDNYMILDIGRNEGVETGMAVISPKGIAGIIDKVSANFSSVISVLHSQSKVSVRLASSGYTGTLVWQGIRSDEAWVVDIPSHIQVAIGEMVVTSGLSLVYPGGIPVGFVSEVHRDKGGNFNQLKIRFSEDYRSLEKVYVVRNLYKNELETLNR